MERLGIAESRRVRGLGTKQIAALEREFAPDAVTTRRPRQPTRLVVLAGPTAVGKGTVAAAVRERHPDVWISVSATTRAPRPGEVDGVHYHFVDDAEFDRLVAEDELLEWAVVHGRARYGTPRRPVEASLAAGRPSLLEIDLQGARQVRETMPDAMFVFLKPPVVGRAGAPAGRPGHRDRGRARAPARPPRATSWPPRRSSTSPSSTTKFTTPPTSW